MTNRPFTRAAPTMKVDYKMIDEESDLTVAAPCGLYCGNCPIFRTYFDRDKEKAANLAKSFKCKPEQIRCSGCRTSAQFRWSADCEFQNCTEAKGIKICYECDGFPCDKIKSFAESAPHHKAIWANFKRMKAVGWRQWVAEQDEKWRCGVCRAKLDYYDEACPTCGIRVS